MAQDFDLICSLRNGFEQHLDLSEARDYLESAGKVFGHSIYVDGNEGFTDSLKEFGGSLGRGLFQVGSWASGKAYAGLKKGFTELNKQLNLSFSSNHSLIRKISSGVGSSTNEDPLEVPAEVVSVLTSEGNIDTIDEDYKHLAETCLIIKKYTDDLSGYLEKSLGIIKRFNSVKDDKGAIEVYEAFIALKFPALILQNKQSNEATESPVLPNGRIIKVSHSNNGKTVDYSMSGSKPSGTAGTLPMGKSEVKAFVDKLNPLNELYKTLIKANERYLKFSSDWASAVKSIYEHLENVNSISSTVHKDIEYVLQGNTNCLAFYSGFTPRLSTYVNKYIHDVLNLASKLI